MRMWGKKENVRYQFIVGMRNGHFIGSFIYPTNRQVTYCDVKSLDEVKILAFSIA